MDQQNKSIRQIVIKRHFDAAHKLENYQGECARLHGHRWEVDFYIRVDMLENGIGYDFTEAKKKLDEILPDHGYLNEVVFQPTAENIAEYLFGEASKIYPVDKVTVWETPECAASFCR